MSDAAQKILAQQKIIVRLELDQMPKSYQRVAQCIMPGRRAQIIKL